jgi:hypothetical protein
MFRLVLFLLLLGDTLSIYALFCQLIHFYKLHKNKINKTSPEKYVLLTKDP